ncbi:hypothetical protein ACFL5M_06135, partial [Candidatus Neomarinimicrobiota bacterium]
MIIEDTAFGAVSGVKILARFDGTVVKRGNREVVLPANSSTVIGQLDFEQEMDENPEHMTYRKDSYENR